MAHVGQKTALGPIGGLRALAGLNQLRLVAFPLGNVLRDSDHPNQLPALVANGKRPVQDPFLPPLGRSYAEFRFGGFAPYLPVKHDIRPIPIVGMDRFRPGHRVPVETVAGSSPNLFVCGAGIEDLAASRKRHPKHFADALRQLAKLLFARPQSLLGLFALGDVLAGADEPQELAARRKARHCVRLHPSPLAIGAPATLFALKRHLLF